MDNELYESRIEHFETQLEEMITKHGSFEDIRWGTMYGELLTLGTMTDNHVENSLNHHYGMRFVMLGRISYTASAESGMDFTVRQLNLDADYATLEACMFNEYLMREIKHRRGTA